MSRDLGVSFISSYVPRRCGIATFTNDLATSITNLKSSNKCFVNVTALNDNSEGYKYPSEVNFEIKDKSINEFKEAASYINLSEIDVVNIQHEFGLYGGEGGSNILYLIEKLNKPIVTTLHTVLENPSKEEAKVLKEIAKRSSYLVVQSLRSFRMLEEVMKIPRSKIKFIPHGAHDVPFIDPAFYKDKFKLLEKKVILTFGLLGPGKGHEDVINSLPEVISKYPDVMYIILGATHPNVKRQSGESYRNSLENLVKRSGMEKNVMFINKFVETKELIEFLLMSDIYVSPYRNREQAVSGTLTYALACGKAVVSTPYWYAEELLGDGNGVLVPFNDPKSMSNSISDLLLDENKRNRLRKKAYDAGRGMTWSNVAKMYCDIFHKAAVEFKTYTTLVVPVSLNNVLPSLPEVNLTHLKNLTDCTGIFQHATYSIPNLHHGYCTDDNVRALLVTFMHKSYFNDESVNQLINIYLTFVHHSLDTEQGLFKNFMSYERKWLEETGSDDCNGRVIFVLGYIIKNSNSRSMLGLAKNLFDQSIKNMANFKSPRAMAHIIIGCIFYLNKFSGASEIKKILNKLSYELFEFYINVKADDWNWFETSVTYENARLPHALLMAGEYLNNEEFKTAGMESLEWYYNILYDKEKNYISLIGNEGWLEKGKVKSKYDQQAVEIPSLIDACYHAYLISNDNEWIKRIGISFSWFLGNNERQEPVVEFTTGGCYDGLTSTKVNENQGAESTISWLLTLHRMIIISHQLQINNEESKKNYLKNLLELLKETYYEFLDDKGFKMAAALSYYSAFALGPLLIIIISIAGFIFGEEAARGEIVKQIQGLMGTDGAQMIETIIKGAANKTTGIIATAISIIFLVLGAVGVFLELQESLNMIWGVELRPGRGIWGFIKNRLISFSMVVATGFLLMISLIINSAISLVYGYFGTFFGSDLPLTDLLNNLSSFLVTALLFALIFKYLPDVLLSWKYVWMGAFITSFLFTAGKYLIGLYLGSSSYASTYGAAASLVILFLWIYYSGLILFFGAEFTQVYRSKYGPGTLSPDSDGVIIPKVSQLVKNSIESNK